MTEESEFSRRAGHRLLKNTTGRRVSADAADTLLEELQAYGEWIAAKAEKFAEHADRKTIQEEDVREAISESSL